MTALTLPTTPADALHRTTPLHAVAAGELLVHEIYLSVQGESTYAGLPCVFVRTSVCAPNSRRRIANQSRRPMGPNELLFRLFRTICG